MLQVHGLSGMLSLITLVIVAVILISLQHWEVTPSKMNLGTAVTFLPVSLPLFFAGGGVLDLNSISGGKLTAFMVLLSITLAVQIFSIPKMARVYQARLFKVAHVPLGMISATFVAALILSVVGIKIEMVFLAYSLYVLDYVLVIMMALAFWGTAIKDRRKSQLPLQTEEEEAVQSIVSA